MLFLSHLQGIKLVTNFWDACLGKQAVLVFKRLGNCCSQDELSRYVLQTCCMFYLNFPGDSSSHAKEQYESMETDDGSQTGPARCKFHNYRLTLFKKYLEWHGSGFDRHNKHKQGWFDNKGIKWPNLENLRTVNKTMCAHYIFSTTL